MRLTLAVGCVVVWMLAGCGDEGAQSAATSTTRVVDESWFAFSPVLAVTPPPCESETVPSSDLSACYELGDRLVGPGGVIAAEAVELLGRPADCPEDEIVCVVDATSPSTSQAAPTAWGVALTVSADALRVFNAAAAECFQQTLDCPSGQVAIVIDGVVMSAPTIQQSEFEADAFQVSGDFTEAEARDLASRLS